MERYLNMKFKNLIGFCVARVSKLHGFVADFYKTSYFYYGKFSAKFLYFLVRQIFQNVTVSSKSSVPTHLRCLWVIQNYNGQFTQEMLQYVWTMGKC